MQKCLNEFEETGTFPEVRPGPTATRGLVIGFDKDKQMLLMDGSMCAKEIEKSETIKEQHKKKMSVRKRAASGRKCRHSDCVSGGAARASCPAGMGTEVGNGEVALCWDCKWRERKEPVKRAWTRWDLHGRQ